MDIEKAKRVKELVDEITELSECKKMFNNKSFVDLTHFKMKKSYSDDKRDVVFSVKYTPMFMEVVDQILSDLNTELLNL